VKITGLEDLVAFDSYLEWISRRNLCVINLNLNRLSRLSAILKNKSIFAKLKTLNVENDTVAFKARFVSLIKASGPTLEFLHLFKCKFIDNSIIIAIADNCIQLVTFSMPCKSGPNKTVTDQAIIKLAEQCPHLEVFYVGNFTSLTDAALTAVTKHCLRLRELTMCHIPKLTDASLLEVTACPHLTLLYVRDCPLVTVALMERVCSACSGLLELTMVSNGLVCAAGWTVTLNSLVALRLVGVTLTDDLLGVITAQCVNLQELMLVNQSVELTSMGGYACIATNCRSLTELTLSECRRLQPYNIEDILKSGGQRLKLLEFSDNYFLFRSLAYITRYCTNLQSLNLSSRRKCCWDTETTILVLVKTCKQLNTLKISNIYFASNNWSKILKAMRETPSFESLYLINCIFASGFTKEIEKLLSNSTKPVVYLSDE
jgi:hypothetical protein